MFLHQQRDGDDYAKHIELVSGNFVGNQEFLHDQPPEQLHAIII